MFASDSDLLIQDTFCRAHFYLNDQKKEKGKNQFAVVIPAPGFQHQAYVTMATNDVYAIGAMVLGVTLRQSGTERRLVAMITSEVTEGMRGHLSKVFDVLFQVDTIDSMDSGNPSLLRRDDLGVTFTKIHCWRLVQFEKGVFLDADTMVLQNIDDLFDREELSAAPDAERPDCFNSGVFVFR